VSDEFSIRPGTLDDVETVVTQRRAMFLEMGYRDEAAMDAMCERFRPWLQGKMQAGEYLVWFAVTPEGEIAAGVGLWLMDWPPHMLGPGRWRGNILNVYTRPASRQRGLARRLTQTAIDWCRANRLSTVILHASDAGRPLYTAMGFQPSTEMRMLMKIDEP
jgi:GNAT superfamily N-acetyltransferase